jgi:DegV family protein with EDD domain
MNDYVIMTDSSADIPADILALGEIEIIPMVFELNKTSVSHTTSADWDSKKFYDKLRQGGSGSTSQIPPVVYTEYFEKQLKEGKDILYISLSAGLTSTWQSSCLAASDLLEEYPDRKIICIDSHAATGGQGILTVIALDNQKKGMTLQENTAWLEANRNNICHWFTVDDLDFLKRGGRISPTIAWIGGKLKIKPVLRIAEDGKLDIAEKVRGAKAAIGNITGKYRASSHDPEYPYVFLCHGDAEEQAEKMKEEILAATPEAKVSIMPMSPVIGIHTGPGVQSVIYYGNNR